MVLAMEGAFIDELQSRVSNLEILVESGMTVGLLVAS